jgi:hypothetical protein
VILCSDGLLERRDSAGGAFGEAGVRRAVADARGSAAATARAIQHAAVGAADGPLEDDAVVVVLAVE